MFRKRHLLVAAVLAGAVTAAGAAYAFGPGYGPAGYGPGYGWQQGVAPGWGMAPGFGPGPGMRGGRGGSWGPHAPGVAPWATDGDVTVDEVKQFMTWQMQRHNNPNLKVGKVEIKDDTTIIAEIVTKDDSLVNRVEINRKTGFFRPAQ
jgi:hypothetical protein